MKYTYSVILFEDNLPELRGYANRFGVKVSDPVPYDSLHIAVRLTSGVRRDLESVIQRWIGDARLAMILFDDIKVSVR